MKIQYKLATIFTGLALAVGATVINSQSSQASANNTYYCAQLNGTWNTFVNTPRGKVKLINWVKTHSENWTPRNRCVAVSERFQRFLDEGTLKYIRTGVVKEQPVICVANVRGGNCPDENVLITFKPDTDPETVLIQLIDFRRSVSGQTIVLSENDAGFYKDGEFYVNMDKFLQAVPAEN